jgi:hypothetical protein
MMENPFEIKEPEVWHGQTLVPGFYYYDETGDWHGPFNTLDEAAQALSEYCRLVLGEGKEELK